MEQSQWSHINLILRALHFKYNVETGSSNTMVDENVLTFKVTGT